MKKVINILLMLLIITISNSQQTTITGKRKTYTNKQLGFTFRYPDTWAKYGEESNAINRKGEVMSTLINFIDTTTHSIFFIEYHLAPYGAELYQYSKAQFDSSQGRYATEAKQIKIAGNKAIEAVSIMRSDIKGNTIDPPLRIISIDFLDKKKTGAIALQFKTPLPNSDTEIVKFKRLLSTFKFIN